VGAIFTKPEIPISFMNINEMKQIQTDNPQLADSTAAVHNS
jgi:hypothetical protein